MSEIKAILFDIGNVILFFDNHRVSRRLAPLSGRQEPEVFREVFGLYVENEFDLGRIATHDYFSLIRERLGLELPDSELRIIFSDIFTENAAMSSLLNRLKGRYPLIAVTNTNESHLQYILDRYPVLHFFDHLIASCRLGFKKPHPMIYYHALFLTRTQPGECLFIDDQEKNVVPAQILGFRTHLYRSYEGLLRELAQICAFGANGAECKAQRYSR